MVADHATPVPYGELCSLAVQPVHGHGVGEPQPLSGGDFLVFAMETNTDTTVQGYRCVAWLEGLAKVTMAWLDGQ